jgi:nucleoid-associated protein YgaU
MCFYAQQRWSEASYWLEKIEVNQTTSPLVYLVLARAKIEQQQYPAAKELMFKFEARKTEIDARSLWTTIEVYRALNQPAEANKYGNHLRSLFPNNQFTRKYLFLVKREQRKPITQRQLATSIRDSNQTKPTLHIIKKGETLYQLSKRYGVTIPELQTWNPSLVINNISVGTQIQVTRSQ